MIKVAVCDDDEFVRNVLNSIIKEYFEKENEVVLIESFADGVELLGSGTRFDIIFLDIEMPRLNGIETAKKLRTWDINSKIIYVTNYPGYKSQAYQVHAFDYLSKPVTGDSVCNVLKEAIRYMKSAEEKIQYEFDTEKGKITLKVDEIYYFEYLSRRVIISSTKGKYMSSYSLRMLYKKFSDFNFELSHKSFLINMVYIKSIKGFDILLENGERIPLAQKRAVEFKEKFNNFLQTTYDKI